MRKLHLFLLSCVFLSTSFLAQGAISYFADAESSFTLLDSGGMSIFAESGLELPTEMVVGSATSSIDADFQTDPTLFPASSLIQASSVSGSASAPSGSSSTEVMNSYLITLENTDDMAATALFEFSFEWDVSITQGPPSEAAFESGLASVFFHLSGFAPSGSETLAIDEGAGIMSVSEWLVNPFITFDFEEVVAPMSMSGSTSVLAYVTVPAFGLDQFSVITDAIGAASHIAEPTLLTLIMGGWVFIAVGRKKQRKLS